LKRLLLSALLALGLHALMMTVKVEWARKEPPPPSSPIHLSLAYKGPESPAPLPPPLVETPEEAPPLPQAEKPGEPKKDLVPKQKAPLPRKKPSPRMAVQKSVREVTEAAKPAEAQPVAEESTGTAPKMAPPPSISPAPGRAMASAVEGSFAPPPGPGPEPSAAPSRQAVPLYLKNPPPEYPPAARRRGYEGTVMMEVLVDRGGKVQDLRLVESSGHGLLDRAAMGAVKRWMFEPARHGEEKVDMWVKVPLTFRLKE
jgi:periplasmic protein TonB